MYAEKVPVRNDWTILEISENTEEGQVILAFSNTFYFAFQLIYSSFLVIRFNQITLFPRSAARVLITTPEERKSRLENARHTESCENQQLSLQRRCEQRRARLERGTSVHTYGLLCFWGCECFSKKPNNATKLGELPKYTSQTVISAFNMRAFPSLLEVFKRLAKGKTWDWVSLNMLG